MRPDRTTVPPMGQGLAVIASLIAIGFIFLLGIGSYLVSLRVQAHRTEAARLDDKVVATRQQVQQLRNELEFRSRYMQLERWREPLGLGPIGIDRLGQDPREIASIAARQRAVGAPDIPPVAKVDASGRASYTPAARHQMDSLIDDITG